MARIRTIKPSHWNDKELTKISLQAHLLWIGLWNFSDDEGIFEADPHLIRSQVFPRRTDIRIEQVTQWLDQLSMARYIIPFTHDGAGYYIHRTFKTHQKIDRPQPSKIPSETIRRIFDESSTIVRPCIVEESKGEESSAPARADTPPQLSDLGTSDQTTDAEQTILASPIELEMVLMKTSTDQTFGKQALRKYHLHLLEREAYPVSRRSVFAGFEKWLMNEKRFSPESSTDSVGKRMVY
jgi:hypothetical protein